MPAVVLVVEDDPALVHAITRNLAARHYTVCAAMTVADALEALEDKIPDLAILDIDLPDGSGWEVLRALREKGKTQVPAIVMSALRPNPRLCSDLNATGVLEKPFPMELLMRMVAQEMDPTAAGREGEQG